MELNNKIRKKKDLSGLAVLKSFLCVCEKWLVIFVISKFFLPTNVLKRSAVADDRPLFAMLIVMQNIQIFYGDPVIFVVVCF